MSYLTKMNGKYGQNGFSRTSAWMHVGRAMQEQLPSSFSILGQPPVRQYCFDG